MSAGKSVCKTGFCNFTSSHSSILVFQKGGGWSGRFGVILGFHGRTD